MKLTTKFSFWVLLCFFISGCGGGGGGGGSCTTSSQFQYCTGSGSFYYCTPVGGSSTTCSSGSGSSSTPEPQATPFATGVAMSNIVSQTTNISNMSPSPFAPTPDMQGRGQSASVQITKIPSNDTFNSAQVTKQTTAANWSGVILASDYQGWYPTPYQLFFNSSNDLVGFSIDGKYGKRTGGGSIPASANDQGTGQIGQFDVFSDSAMTTNIGSATFTYRVNNCCDLYSKEKATLKLELTGNTTAGTFTLTQSFVIFTNGNIKSFGSESYSVGGAAKTIALPYNGY